MSMNPGHGTLSQDLALPRALRARDAKTDRSASNLFNDGFQGPFG
jgi:hypothetical protein